MKPGRSIMWLALPAIGSFAILSVLGAFGGAQKAKLFFNSSPLIINWFCLGLLLTIGFFRCLKMHGKNALVMIYAGCLLVLAGSMWGSQTGHTLRANLFNIQKIPEGYMIISEGNSEKYLTSENLGQRLVELPFSIRLNDFRVEFYDTDEDLMVRDYLSDVTIIENRKEIVSKTIEVNHPLHYRGYHFYQHGYDLEGEQSSVLSAVSDSGLYVVYAGYWLIGLGVIWQFWLRHIVRYIWKNANKALE